MEIKRKPIQKKGKKTRSLFLICGSFKLFPNEMKEEEKKNKELREREKN